MISRKATGRARVQIPPLRLVLLIAFSLGVAGSMTDVSAQTFPDRPLRFIVPFPAGGATDAVARAMQPALENFCGQSVVVENRSGAGSVLEFMQSAEVSAGRIDNRHLRRRRTWRAHRERPTMQDVRLRAIRDVVLSPPPHRRLADERPRLRSASAQGGRSASCSGRVNCNASRSAIYVEIASHGS